MRAERATILVTTLWIITLLTLLALGIGIRMGVDIKLMGFFLNSTKARYLAEAGIRKTIMFLETDENKKADALSEIWSCGFDFDEEEYVLKDIELGDGTFTVSYELGKDEDGKPVYLYGASDEEGKLNINELDAEALARIPGFSNEVVASILDWRDEDSLARLEGAESEYYAGLDNPYECKDAKFSVPEELLLVKGVTGEIYDNVRDIITVYGDSAKVNINTAKRDVLAAIMGIEFEDIADKIVRYRNGSDETPGTEDDRFFKDTTTIVAELSSLIAGGLNMDERNYLSSLVKKNYFKVYSNTFRVVSRGEMKNRRVSKTIEAVVKRGEGDTKILYYHEN